MEIQAAIYDILIDPTLIIIFSLPFSYPPQIFLTLLNMAESEVHEHLW